MTTPRDRKAPQRPTAAPVAAGPTAHQADARRARQAAVGLVRAVYEDDDGRRWTVLVPPGREADASMGIVVGPPDLGALGLPAPVALRLHNELQGRGLLNSSDLRGKQPDIFAALQAAYRVDVAAVLNLYARAEQEGGDGDHPTNPA